MTRVFVIDDDHDHAESIADVLMTCGHDVELAFSGEAALDRFCEANFEIVFMDVKLPGMNGVETFFEFKKIRPGAQVMMMTGFSLEQLIAQAVDNGALGVLRKPFSIDNLLKVVGQARPRDGAAADKNLGAAASRRSLQVPNRRQQPIARKLASWGARLSGFIPSRRQFAGILGCALLVLACAAAQAEESGISADRIVFGQIAALTGPAAALGTGMREGILAAFAEANAAGGVQGRELTLVSLDDGYEPNNTISATSKLIRDNNTFALIGSVGTPTTNAILPLIAEAGLPLIGPFTGSEGLRNPFNPLVVNVRASYFQETEIMVERLTKDLGVTRIAIFYQDDSFGRAGLAGVQRALDRRGMKLVSEGTYQRNTTVVRGALTDILKGRPEAVILIGAYAPCAEFIKLARQQKLDAAFVNISFVGPEALAKDLGPDGAGVVVTQVVPYPEDASMPLVADYQKALKAASPQAKPSFVSLEGYMAGRLTVMALRKIPENITRKALLQTIAAAGPFDLGGLTLSFSPSNNQGSNQVFLTAIKSDGSFNPVASLKEVKALGSLFRTEGSN